MFSSYYISLDQCGTSWSLWCTMIRDTPHVSWSPFLQRLQAKVYAHMTVVVVVPLIIIQENERKDREWLIVLWFYSSADITTPNPHTVTPSGQPLLTTAQHDLVSHPSTTASSYSSGIVLRNLIHEHLLSLLYKRSAHAPFPRRRDESSKVCLLLFSS